MKRSRPDPAAIERAREHAEGVRIKAGLPAEDDSELGRMLEERVSGKGEQKARNRGR